MSTWRVVKTNYKNCVCGHPLPCPYHTEVVTVRRSGERTTTTVKKKLKRGKR